MKIAILKGEAVMTPEMRATIMGPIEAAAKWEAIRQMVNCPTCDGTCEVPDTERISPFGGTVGYKKHCPDCTEGKIDMLRLLAVGAAVFNEHSYTSERSRGSMSRDELWEATGHDELLHELRNIKL